MISTNSEFPQKPLLSSEMVLIPDVCASCGAYIHKHLRFVLQEEETSAYNCCAGSTILLMLVVRGHRMIFNGANHKMRNNEGEGKWLMIKLLSSLLQLNVLVIKPQSYKGLYHKRLGSKGSDTKISDKGRVQR